MRKLCLLFLAVVAMASSAAAVTVIPPANSQGTPVEFGLQDLVKATKGLKPNSRIVICRVGEKSNTAVKAASKMVPARAESFAIAKVGNDIAVVGRDNNGTMYGCFELAERIEISGANALNVKKPIVQSPRIEFRAANPFLTLPYKESDEDWYFLQEDYWKGYLDQLARARINWVDLHGMYDIKSTGFPNLYPYFITSDKFPEVGVEPAAAKRNLDMLNKIIAMAKARGIKFGIMSYAAKWDGPGLRKVTYDNSEANMSAYTREVVRKMIESCPDLAMIGFRIGETGRSADFFKESYIPAIKEAGRPIDLYTRTWLSSKPPILAIGKDFPGRFFIEIKYNGEQFGPPYIVAGGRMQRWHSYSYQDYYTYPKSYKIIYQLRANGTHRVFPWGNPEMAARANVDSLLGGAIGLCVEPIDSYYPKYDFRHKDDSPNRWYKWQYQRDWYWYNVWGRTAYDPSLKDNYEVWKHMFSKRFGKAAGRYLYLAMNYASMIVPDAYNAYSLGPDHRNHAPELEYGGDIKKWADGQPFDTQSIQSPREFADRLVSNDPSARATPLEMASKLAKEADMTRLQISSARKYIKNPSPEFKDLITELTALSHLADYYSHKLTAAALFAVMNASGDVNGKASGADAVRKELEQARNAWSMLAGIGDNHYKPFIDTLRMGTENYTWTEEGKKLDKDFRALDDAVSAIKASGKTGTAPYIGLRGDGQGPAVIDVKTSITPVPGANSKKLTVIVNLKDARGVDKVYLRTKPFPSERSWTSTPMTVRRDMYSAEVTVMPEGLMWCIEALDKDGNGTMWPDFRKETPYKVVLPWNAPMPSDNKPKQAD